MSLPAVIPRSDLGTFTELARGGIGTVFAADGDFGEPGPSLVVKCFNEPAMVAMRPLYRMVGWRRALQDDERRRLDRVAVWPLAIVTGSDGPIGFVMRRVPPRFEDELRLPSGTYRAVLREAQYLLGAAERNHRLGMQDAVARTRAGIIWELAETLGFLHQRGIVIGDLSARNILWSREPNYVLLVDCDSMTVTDVGSPHRPVETVDWDDPAGQNAASTEADVYKFALFVLRALGRSFQSRDPALVGDALDPYGQGLLRMSLSDDPTKRPTAGAWERWAVGRRAALQVGAR